MAIDWEDSFGYDDYDPCDYDSAYESDVDYWSRFMSCERDADYDEDDDFDE